jgi:hypothetical protein
MFAEVRRIQNSIQVTTAAASSVATPSKICPAAPSSPSRVTHRIAPTMMLSTMAAPAPSQILPKWRAFPVLARYARMMLTMSAASTPSRRPVRRPVVRNPKSNALSRV